MGKVKLYGILAERAGVREIEINTKGRPVIDIVRDIATKYNLEEVLIKDGKIRPLFLIMIDGKDYLSLGLLGKPLDDEKEIRIIPIYHGGARRKKKPLFLGILVIILFLLVILLQFIR